MSVQQLRQLLPWPLILVACATLGLAPFTPQPHFFEKVGMLFAGQLSRPLDIFDLLMHGTPWALLVLRGALELVPVDPGPEDDQ